MALGPSLGSQSGRQEEPPAAMGSHEPTVPMTAPRPGCWSHVAGQSWELPHLGTLTEGVTEGHFLWDHGAVTEGHFLCGREGGTWNVG